MEQRHAELRLQHLDLAADGRLAQEQLLARLGERQVTRCRLEAFQQVEGRQVARFMHAFFASNNCRTSVCPDATWRRYSPYRNTEAGPDHTCKGCSHERFKT